MEASAAETSPFDFRGSETGLLLGQRGIRETAISSLLMADSPRLGGQDGEHVKRLAEINPELLPPIIVHEDTMRVIDGMHRLQAALLQGRTRIKARFFKGSDADAFLVAVKENTAHGLPLTLAERKTAASRIITSYPHLSDRAIGRHTGLSHTTVAAVRRSLGVAAASSTRVGADGRVRPMSSTEGRRRAAEFIAAHPGASVREVANHAAVSVSTAYDVRKQMDHGKDPSSLENHSPRAVDQQTAGADRARQNIASSGLREEMNTNDILRSLAKDPILRYSEAGRDLLHWLRLHAAGIENWQQLIDLIPSHRLTTLFVIAQQCTEEWQLFARELARRGA